MLTRNKSLGKRHTYKKVLYALIGAIILAVLIYVAIPKYPAPIITQITNFTLTLNDTKNFMLPGDSAVYVLYLKSIEKNVSVLYLTRQPILSNPVIVIVLQSGEQAKISTYNGTIANLEIKLLNINGDLAKFSILPIPITMGIGVSGTFHFVQPSVLSSNILYQNTTSVSIVTTSISSTTTVVTSVPPSTNATIPLAQIMQEVNNSVFGLSMNSYNNLYKKDTACNQSVYNATFLKYEPSTLRPIGPFDFYNASLNTPIALNYSVSYLKNGNYLITYSAISKSKRTTGPVLILTLNFSSGTITNSSFVGIYRGLNYSQLYNAYTFQNSINNFCGAYIPPPP